MVSQIDKLMVLFMEYMTSKYQIKKSSFSNKKVLMRSVHRLSFQWNLRGVLEDVDGSGSVDWGCTVPGATVDGFAAPGAVDGTGAS